jgi:hypothetical protein
MQICLNILSGLLADRDNLLIPFWQDARQPVPVDQIIQERAVPGAAPGKDIMDGNDGACPTGAEIKGCNASWVMQDV